MVAEIPVEDQVTVILHCPLCGRDKQMTSQKMLHQSGKVITCECEECSSARPKLIAVVPVKANPLEILENQWQAICPKEYRTAKEGGNTDAARLGQAKATRDGVTLSREELRNAVLASKRSILFGLSGTMKTRFAWRIVRAAYDRKASVKEFTSWSFQAAAQDVGGKYQSDEWMKALAAVDMILIDDLGKTPWTENTWATFFELIERRNNQDKAWIITMNDSRDQMRATADSHKSGVVKSIMEPLIRRLEEYATAYIFQKP